MNERIRELREQAMEWVPNIADPDTKIRLLNAEKFAELIVKECTNLLPEDSIRDSNGVHMFYVIRKHFGVEE